MNNGRQKTLNKCKEMVDLRIYFKVAVMLAMLLLFLLEVRLVSAINKSTNIWRKNFFKNENKHKIFEKWSCFWNCYQILCSWPFRQIRAGKNGKKRRRASLKQLFMLRLVQSFNFTLLSLTLKISNSFFKIFELLQEILYPSISFCKRYTYDDFIDEELLNRLIV